MQNLCSFVILNSGSSYMSVNKIIKMYYHKQSLKELKASLIKFGSKSLFSILNSYFSIATG